jgi:RNA polymerase primary sigma factor
MKQFKISQKITDRTSIALDQYFKEVSKIEAISKDEEHNCRELASAGNQVAIDKLVRSNLRFVISVAKYYANKDNPLEDLINEGNIGLIMAAQRFDPNKDNNFITYAVWWIRKMIMEYITNNSRLVNIPSNKINDLSKFDKKINKLEQRNGGSVTMEDLFHEYCTEDKHEDKVWKEINTLGTLNNYFVDSMDRKISDEDSDASYGDLFADEGMFEMADDALVKKEMSEAISNIINKMPYRDKCIMISLFGLNNSDPKTLQEVGEEVGISREMVRQIREKNLKKIKNQLLQLDYSF